MKLSKQFSSLVSHLTGALSCFLSLFFLFKFLYTSFSSVLQQAMSLEGFHLQSFFCLRFVAEDYFCDVSLFCLLILFRSDISAETGVS